MPATLRYRGRRNEFIEIVKKVDAFKEVPEKYTETTEIGGTLSLLSRLLIIYLIYKECKYYQNANLVYQFQPDVDLDGTVQMHVDITVAMPCASLSGVDLMDETQKDVFAYGTLQRESVWWEMSSTQRLQFERMQHMNSFLRDEYHSVADILFRDIINDNNESNQSPKKSTGAHLHEEQFDACRLHGMLGINKVAGVLQLVAGMQPVVGLFENHFMIELRRSPANFTHRINRLSFGQYSKRLVQPLEGDEVIVNDEEATVQYFLNIVPTEIHNTFSTINTYQYAVTENIRKLDSDISSTGNPGIYFKYDWCALKIIVRSDRDNIIQFVIRLCSIIAGIIVISGILNTVLLSLRRKFISFLAPQLLHKPFTLETSNLSPLTEVQTAENNLPVSNNLLLAANEMIDNLQIPITTPTHKNTIEL